MKILVIDNYDSFTFNLVQMLGSFSAEIIVKRNDRTNIDEIRAMQPKRIVISPGPGKPEDSGISLNIIRELRTEIPILGVCLGHQAIGYGFGGTVTYASQLMHGKTSHVHHDGRTIFAGIEQDFEAGRYHSLVLDPASLPADLEVSARTADGTIMAIRHRSFPLEGIQFHPESVLTPEGESILKNWISL